MENVDEVFKDDYYKYNATLPSISLTKDYIKKIKGIHDNKIYKNNTITVKEEDLPENLQIKNIPTDIFEDDIQHKIVMRQFKWYDNTSLHVSVGQLILQTYLDRNTFYYNPHCENFKISTPGITAKYCKLVIDIDDNPDLKDDERISNDNIAEYIFDKFDIVPPLRWYIEIDYSREVIKNDKKIFKNSYHLIFPTIHTTIEEFTQWKTFFNMTLSNKHIDTSIYSSGRIFRQIGAFKAGDVSKQEPSKFIPSKLTYHFHDGTILQKEKFEDLNILDVHLTLINSTPLKQVKYVNLNEFYKNADMFAKTLVYHKNPIKHESIEDILKKNNKTLEEVNADLTKKGKSREEEMLNNEWVVEHCTPEGIVCKLRIDIVEKLLNNADKHWTAHNDRLRIYSAWKWLEIQKGVELGSLYLPWLIKTRKDLNGGIEKYTKHYLNTEPKCTFYKVVKELNDEQHLYKDIKRYMKKNYKFDTYITHIENKLRNIMYMQQEKEEEKYIKKLLKINNAFCDPTNTKNVHDIWIRPVEEICNMWGTHVEKKDLTKLIFSNIAFSIEEGKRVIIHKHKDGTYTTEQFHRHIVNSKIIQIWSQNTIRTVSIYDYFEKYRHLVTVNTVLSNPWEDIPPQTVNMMPLPRVRVPFDGDNNIYIQYKQDIINYIKDVFLGEEPKEKHDEYVDFILSWTASIIFDDEPTKKALIFTGDQGTGKTSFWEGISLILNKKHIKITNSGLSMLNDSKFKDEDEEFKKLIVLEESDKFSRNIDAEINYLKYITDGGDVRIEKKFKNPRMYKNRANILIISNNFAPILAGFQEQRRYFQIKILKKYSSKERRDKWYDDIRKSDLLLKLLMEYKGKYRKLKYQQKEFQTNALKELALLKITKTSHGIVDDICDAILNYNNYNNPTIDNIHTFTTYKTRQKVVLIENHSYNKLDRDNFNPKYKKWSRRVVDALKNSGIENMRIKNGITFDGQKHSNQKLFYCIPYEVIKDYYDNTYAEEEDFRSNADMRDEDEHIQYINNNKESIKKWILSGSKLSYDDWLRSIEEITF